MLDALKKKKKKENKKNESMGRVKGLFNKQITNNIDLIRTKFIHA